MSGDRNELDEVLFEIRRVGNAVRVTAIDPRTGTEASIVGDPRFGELTLKRNAARKLAYVLRKKAAQESGPP
jgi:hypothetical protein